MNPHPLISIIIPVYNGEKYIAECLESIRKQEFSDYEVIVINDGSTDESRRICEEIAQSEKRLKVCSIENQGVSHARNLGIQYAKAPWILFLDGDDYLAGQCLEAFVQLLKDGSDCIYGDYLRGSAGESVQKSAQVKAEDVLRMTLDPVNQNLLPAFYQLKSSTLNSACGKLYAKEILTAYGIAFDEKLKLSEDFFFNVNYLRRVQKVTLSNLPVFVYRENEASASSNFKEEHLENRLYLFERLRELCPESDVFVLSTLLELVCRIEKYTQAEKKKRLEKEVTAFLENYRTSMDLKGKALSIGRWKNKVFCCCGQLFLKGIYAPAFLILNLYVKVAKGKI